MLVEPLPLLPDLVLHHDGGGPVGRRLLKALAAAGEGLGGRMRERCE